MKVDLLAIGVHPDDIELSCSGTLIKHIAMGRSVGLLDLTQGELGTRGSAEIRLEEAAAAAEIIGAKERINLGLADGFFTNDKESKIKIIEAIRYFRPEIVLANAIDDRHPDHGNAAKLVYEACFLAGLLKIETTFRGVPQEHWRPKALYNYIQDRLLSSDLVVDITGYMDQKMASILAFRSQFFDPNSTEVESPISGKDFLEFIKSRARTYGRQVGVEFGEGFTSARPIGTADLFSLV